MAVSPNPARGKVTVDLGDFTGDAVNLALVTIDGREILTRRFEGLPSHFRTELDLQGVTAGGYLLVIRAKSGVWRRKLVVE
ncbi:MAG: T9SS type A sorting domain-containing protein [Bacteroidota bacterium]